MLEETNKYSKILRTMQKTDSLLLLYMEGNDQISLSVVNEIKESKGKVIFDEIKPLNSLSEEIVIAYRLGILSTKYGDIKVVSDRKVLLELLDESYASKSKGINTNKKVVDSDDINKSVKEYVKSSVKKSGTGKNLQTLQLEEIEPLPSEGDIEPSSLAILPTIEPDEIE